MSPSDGRALTWLVAGALAVYAVLVLRTAWVTDDAFITLRTVRNVLAGNGLRWNLSERVQSYTHPLWMMLLVIANGMWSDPFYATIALSVVTAVAGVAWLGLKVARTPAQGVLGIVLLSLSTGFVDFSTSGLENPLSHLLLAIFVWLYLAPVREPGEAARLPMLSRERRLFALALVAGLLTLNRQDTLLLVTPCLIHETVVALPVIGRRETLRTLAQGFSPVAAWSLFSLFYYGFLVPNTAFAKLSTGVLGSTLRKQGVVYLLHTVSWDPSLIAILGLGWALGFSSRERGLVLLALGSLLYVGYVVNVGGDFMAGRFLTAPAFASVCIVAARRGLFERPTGALLVGLPLLLLSFLPGAVESWRNQHDIGVDGIADERVFYRGHASLMLTTRHSKLPNHSFVREGKKLAGRRVVEVSHAGYNAYYAGPGVHVIDIYGLADPLLARLPIADPEGFRIGHYRRRVPSGYHATLESGRCKMSRSLCRYYAELSLITRGPLLSWARFVAIVRMNLGLDQAPALPPKAKAGARKPSTKDASKSRDADDAGDDDADDAPSETKDEE